MKVINEIRNYIIEDTSNHKKYAVRQNITNNGDIILVQLIEEHNDIQPDRNNLILIDKDSVENKELIHRIKKTLLIRLSCTTHLYNLMATQIPPIKE